MSTPSEPTPATSAAPGWWRRNRWALLALPFALVLALVAAGDRVNTLWWQQDLRRPVTAGTDGAVELHQRIYDGQGGTLPIDVQVRLDGVDDPTTLPDRMTLPPGTRAVQVDLTLSADPDVVLRGCSLAVRDADGTRYDYIPSGWGASQSAFHCVSKDAPGPRPPMGDLDDVVTDRDALPRPQTWSVSRVVVLPDEVQVAEVVLWWQKPYYVLLEVPGEQG